jgi:hypothetical protein
LRGRGRELALALGSLAVALLAIELGLRAFTRHPAAAHWNRIADPMLRWRSDPTLPGIDARGFRNPAALERAEIAVLGDSFTYSFNASEAEAWPRRLERASGRSVYNFGVGGYGVLEYWYLLDEALALQPRRLIAALYVGNDMSDACARLAEPVWQTWVAARGLDGAGCLPAVAATRGRAPRARKREVGPWLVAHTALGSLVDVATAEWRVELAIDLGRVDDAFVVKEKGFRAVMPRRRLRTLRERMDPEQPAAAAGLAAARAFFVDARSRAAAQGARFGVLLIPTKERVYAGRLKASPEPPPPLYTQAVQGEEAITAAVGADLDALGIPHVDARPRLERMLDEIGAFYPLRRDDHPFAPGYAALADAAQELLALLDAPEPVREARR